MSECKNSVEQNSPDQEVNFTLDCGGISWICPKCHAINRDAVCAGCCFERPMPQNVGKKSKNPWKIFSIVMIVAIILVLAFFLINASSFCLFGHEFQPATCEEPQICSSCGITNGEPLGHDYTKATCTKASECTICHKKNGSPLSHNWTPATYTSPKKCTLCGKTEGNVKGYYESLPGKWNTKGVSVGGTNTTPYVFNTKVKNCVKFTINYQIAEVKYGDPYGKHTVYAKINDKWTKIGTFTANDNSLITKTLEFDEPITFKQLAVVGPYRTSGRSTFYMWLEDFYLQD